MKPIKTLLFTVLIFQLASAVIAKQKTVLVISAYHRGYIWTDECLTGINTELKEKYNIVTHYMDTKRIPKSEFVHAAEKAWQKFKEIRPDIILLGDDNALKYIGPRLAKTKTPVVFYGINANPRNYFNNSILPATITGVLERILVKRTAVIVGEIISGKVKILILSEGSITGRGILKTRLGGKTKLRIRNTTVFYEDHPTWEGWKKAVKKAHEKYDALMVVSYHSVKDKNKTVNYNQVLQWTSKNSKLPVFLNQSLVGPGKATGSLTIIGEEHGKLAAGLVIEILENGKDPTTIFPLMDKKGKWLLSNSEIKRFKLTIPPLIKNRASLFELVP